MTQRTTSKKTLLTSALSLLLCCTMLIGTTWAWFTDSVTSSGNIIKSGKLNIDLGIKTKDDDDYVSVKENPDKKAFNYDKWEPGYTEWVNAKVFTTGNLALKYTMTIVANGEVSKLAKVIDVYYAPSEVAKPDNRDLSGLTLLGTLDQAISGEIVINDTLIPDTNTVDFATLALHMQETAGNEYQNLGIGTDLSIQILATQYTYESDSFDNQYDDRAEYPEAITGVFANVNGDGAVEFTVNNVPADGKATNVAITGLDDVNAGDPLALNVETTALEAAAGNSAFAVNDGETAVAGIDLSLVNSANQKVTFSGGTATVTTYIVPGLDPANISVKYNGDGDDATFVSYNAETGELIFTTTHFSKFYVVYAGEWAYVPQLNRAFVDYDEPADPYDVALDAVCEYAETCVTDLDKIDIDKLVTGFNNNPGMNCDSHVAYELILLDCCMGDLRPTTVNSDLLKYVAEGVTTEQALRMQQEYYDAYHECKIASFPLNPPSDVMVLVSGFAPRRAYMPPRDSAPIIPIPRPF